MNSRPAGFTLHELVVVLLILGVSLALGVPALQGLSRFGAVRGGSHHVSSSLALARMTAVARGTPVSVCPGEPATGCRRDGVWDGGWLVFRDPQRLGRPAAAVDLLEVVSRPPGRPPRIRSSRGRSLVRFLPDGRSAGSNLSIRVCSGRPDAPGSTLVVNNAGRIRIESLDGDHPDCLRET